MLQRLPHPILSEALQPAAEDSGGAAPCHSYVPLGGRLAVPLS